ncbi:hypothetical protein RvY_02843 [Ramazzottius varieornatus]|uniref:Uncharacterized protein n=1 Tax=Ramazzottius varieornatus TaxID=947166 RepID=A0A1D1UL29_RAMVA|nr:hypothetical protein RvY_02843 [Ramazzottius varieornatus]
MLWSQQLSIRQISAQDCHKIHFTRSFLKPANLRFKSVCPPDGSEGEVNDWILTTVCAPRRYQHSKTDRLNHRKVETPSDILIHTSPQPLPKQAEQQTAQPTTTEVRCRMNIRNSLTRDEPHGTQTPSGKTELSTRK